MTSMTSMTSQFTLCNSACALCVIHLLETIYEVEVYICVYVIWSQNLRSLLPHASTAVNVCKWLHASDMRFTRTATTKKSLHSRNSYIHATLTIATLLHVAVNFQYLPSTLQQADTRKFWPKTLKQTLESLIWPVHRGKF